ncbi:MAG: DUF937 domain-containing protein [Pyrinomonadaceae bacterium]|nr:DUF937 domain-containing protein [Pyrinomonadaceae bacterium]
MFGLDQLLGQDQGDQALQQISNQVGAEPSLVNSAIQMALPAILGGLANNASTPEGAESLNNALDQHDGSILDNLGGLGSMIFGGGQQTAPPPQTNAGGILGHIFGNSQGQVAQQVSQQTGLGTSQVAQILMMLAPIVMGYLGQQKQSQGLDAGSLGGLLGGLMGGGQQQASAGNPMLNILGNLLDSDHDGSAVDDIASMAFKNILGGK